jgi:hypothetical protein
MTGFGQAYDRWLDDNNPANNDYQYAFEEAHEHLMNHKYNPHYTDVFLEALYECDLENQSKELAQAIAEGESGYDKLGKVIWDAVYQYLDSLAKIEAKKQCEAIKDFI